MYKYLYFLLFFPSTCYAFDFKRGISVESMLGLTLWNYKSVDFCRYKESGFDLVRLPFTFESVLPEKKVSLYVNSVVKYNVDKALNCGLKVVIDLHAFTKFKLNPDSYAGQFSFIWQDIFRRFQHYPKDRLAYEILNEPSHRLTKDKWRGFLTILLENLKNIDNSKTILIGTPNYSSVYGLTNFQPIKSTLNLVYVFHYYSPMSFTHQGASWNRNYASLVNVKWIKKEHAEAMINDFDRVYKWAKNQGVKVVLGEYGVIKNADFESRLQWVSSVTELASKYDFPCIYWDTESAFAAYYGNQEEVRRFLNLVTSY